MMSDNIKDDDMKDNNNLNDNNNSMMDNNNIKDNALGLLTAKNYTWDKTANIIIKNMK